MDQLFVAVGRGSGRIDQLIPDALELVQEHLVGLAAKAAQGSRLVQADGREGARVDVAVPYPLVVGHEDGRIRCVCLGLCADIGRRGNVQQVFGIIHKLSLDIEWQDDQRFPAGVFLHQPAPLQLHNGFAQAKPGKQRPASAAQRPQHAGALVRFEDRVQFIFPHIQAG